MEPEENLVDLGQPEWLAQIEGLLETLNEGVIVTDDCNRILYVNSCFEEMIGRSSSEMVGQVASQFYTAEEFAFILKQIELSVETGRNRFEFVLPLPDGGRMPVIVSSRRLEDPDGRDFAIVTFTDISHQKNTEAKLRDANVRLEERQREIDEDLTLAARVQQSLAPRSIVWGGLKVDTYYHAVRTIGGDFGLVSPHEMSHLDLLICDVSGHGISSALLANRIYTETVSLLRSGSHPGKLLHTLNKFVVEQIGISGFMFTMAAARLDYAGRKLTYAAGGHPPGFLISQSGELKQLDSRSTILGAMEDAVPQHASDTYELSAGDRLMIYSDGLTEVWDAKEEMLGIEGLAEIARKAVKLPLDVMREKIIKSVVSFSATPVHDDMSLVLLEVR